MRQLISILVIAFLLIACKKENSTTVSFKQDTVQLATHQLATYAIIKNSRYLVVFESGMGDGHSIWQTKKTAETISSKMDVVIYDRAGYENSGIDSSARNVSRLRTELEAVVNKYANGRKVILVGHSIGGLIIRDYAIKNPVKTAALLFIDPSHERYNTPTQEIEDLVFNLFKDNYGANFGATREARELIEDFAYTSTLPNLPNVPVTVITSMKPDDANNNSDSAYNKTRLDWYNAHESLKTGVTDFVHIQTTSAGHYIFTEAPALVTDNIIALIAKLP